MGQQQPEEKHRDSGKDYHFNMSYKQDVRKDEIDNDGDDGDDNYHANMTYRRIRLTIIIVMMMMMVITMPI